VGALTEKQSAAIHLLIDVPPDRVVLRPVYPAPRPRPVGSGAFVSSAPGDVVDVPVVGGACAPEGEVIVLQNTAAVGPNSTVVVASGVISRPCTIVCLSYFNTATYGFDIFTLFWKWSFDNSIAGGLATSGSFLKIQNNNNLGVPSYNNRSTLYPMIRLTQVPCFLKQISRTSGTGSGVATSEFSLVYL
jgi:hypothetical protein